MRTKTCTICGAEFGCGFESAEQTCWCGDLPPIIPMDRSDECLCPACLKARVQAKIAEYVATVTPETALTNTAKDLPPTDNPVAGIDYYINEDGLYVFTTWHHLKRGYCCKSGCKHCPYGFTKPKGGTAPK